MNLNPYLNFNGQCEEAFKFYESALGGKIEVMMTHEGTPAEKEVPAEWRKKIIHGRITIGGTNVMASDAPPGRYSKPQGFFISLGTEKPADAERLFAALSEKGTVQMAMQQTFFAQRFGMAVDQFGIPWMVICENAR